MDYGRERRDSPRESSMKKSAAARPTKSVGPRSRHKMGPTRSYVIHSVVTIHLVQWLGLVFSSTEKDTRRHSVYKSRSCSRLGSGSPLYFDVRYRQFVPLQIPKLFTTWIRLPSIFWCKVQPICTKNKMLALGVWVKALTSFTWVY